MVFCALFCAWSGFVVNKENELNEQKVYMVMAHFVNYIGTSVYFKGKKYVPFYNAGDKDGV